MAVVRKLNGMIRNAEKLRINLNVGFPLHVEITKQSMLQAIAAQFPEGGETGLRVNEDGYLDRETHQQ